MKYIRQIYIAITLSLIASLSYAYGDDDYSSACGESENCLSCEPDCCGTWFIGGELLYWRAFENGLDTCLPIEVSDKVKSDGEVISKFKGKSRDPHFKWNPGFRIGAGYELACSEWDIAVFWTHFHSHASQGSDDDDNEIRWNINFDVIDVIAVYNIDLGSCFVLRPFGGLRGAKIDQKLRIGEFSSSTNSSISIDKESKEKLSGIGPLVGLEVDWSIGCDFSLYLGGDISWLYGDMDVKFSESEEFVDAANFCKISKDLDACLTVFDAALGIRWQTCFCTNKRLILGLGLEHHCYFDYNRIGDYGDLSFDGVNFSAGIEF